MRLTPLKAIRKFCLECCGGERVGVSECTANEQGIAKSQDPELYKPCFLYEFRFGTNPRRKRVGGGVKIKSRMKKGHSLRGLDG